MVCNNCGGAMLGDGYTEPFHCENVDLEEYAQVEPDCNPIDCTGDNNDK